MQERLRQDENGFSVSKVVSPEEWADIETGLTNAYVHVVFDSDNRTLVCYMADPDSTVEVGTPRIKTTVENVNLTPHYIGEEKGVEAIDHFYLTSSKAETFQTFLAAVFTDRDPERQISLSWWEDSGMRMMERGRKNIETLNLRYEERRVQIQSAWQTRLHRMVRMEENS